MKIVPHRRSGLHLELLEDRCLLSTVTILTDYDPGSLRDAIATTPNGRGVERSMIDARSFSSCACLPFDASPREPCLGRRTFSQPVINSGVALASDFARAQQEADNFPLSQAASVQTIEWWGAYANNSIGTDNFTLRFFGDAAGNPAMTPFANVSGLNVTRTATNLVDNLGDTIYQYQAALVSPVTLDAATTYYLSLVNDTGDWDWVGGGPGTHWARQDDTSAWTPSANSTDFAFELSGSSVPERPTVMLLAMAGLGVLVCACWPKRCVG
jgi:hypothetical protein